MFRILRHILTLVKVLYVISKYQIIPPSKKSKITCNILSFVFYPKNLFIKQTLSFGDRLAKAFQSLGPIYIKFGQTLSTRPDLIGDEIAESLKCLQDKLPPFSIDIVKNKIQKNFNKILSEIFIEFDEKPIAAASIAQVHKAKIKTGEVVAVKLLRPNINQEYEKDIQFLEYCAKIAVFFLKKVERLKPKEVISVFRKSMQLELNLRLEAAAASRIHDNFINDNTLRIPKIYWEYTTNDILTLEWVEGVSIYDKCKIINLGLDPINIASKIAVIFFNQAYRDGFFHADLHPGNILVCNDGKIGLIDFGIVGILSEEDRLAIAEILYGFLTRNYKLVAEVHHKIGYIPKETNLELFAQSCRAVAEPILGLAIKNISIGNLLSQLFIVTEEYGMETQPQLLLLQKTMIVVEGIGQSLDNNINMWQLAEPWIKKWAAKNLSIEAKLLRISKKMIEKILKQ